MTKKNVFYFTFVQKYDKIYTTYSVYLFEIAYLTKGEHIFVRHNMKGKKKGTERNLYQKMYSYKKKKLAPGFLAGVVALLMALLASICGNVLACIISIFSLFISGGELLSKTLRGGKREKADDGLFVLLAVLVTFFLGRFAMAAIAMAIYKLAGVILMYVSGLVGDCMMKSANVLPAYANQVDADATIRRIPVSSVTRGMKIMVKPGETVPADSVISDGFSDFDTSNVYLSKDPVSLSAGDKVLGGFVNMTSSVTCEVLCDGENSLVSEMRRLAEHAENGSTKGEKRFSSIAKWYSPAVLVLAIIVLMVGGFTTGAWTNAMMRACVLLLVASTGSYIMASPLARSCAAWNLKKKGLAVASADLIDEIADINLVAFEKDGILTDGVYTLGDVYVTEDVTKEDFLMIAANCIGGRQHPVSKVLTMYMNTYLVTENVIEFPGKGVECTIMGKTFLCGSESFVKDSGVDIGDVTGYTVYVTIDGTVMGALTVEDTLKENTQAPLQVLRDVGVEKIVLFSSDSEEIVEPASAGCGADAYYADLTPYKRAEVIGQLKEDENVTCAYIGDLANGSQAMEAADVGITLVQKSDSEIKHSKVALLGELSTIAETVEIARLACSKIEMHFYCATAVKIVLALLGLFGAINIASAIVIDTLLALVALVSALDLLKK